MAIRISGPGVGLPVPRGVLPERIPHGGPFPAFQPPTNRFSLVSGQSWTIPAGNWIVQSHGGTTSEMQFLDPIGQQWQPMLPPTQVAQDWTIQLFSDGENYRVFNTAQVGTNALVTAPGSGYVQATTTVTPSTGNSVWIPIVGGALGNLTLTAPGANYSIPPFIVFSAPPPPGLPARAHAVLATDGSGSVASFVLDTPGAGYKSVPQVFIGAMPNEPNHDNFTQAHATVEVVGAGTITAVLLQNFGQPLPTPPTLTISGSGTGATAVVEPTTWIGPTTEVIWLQPAAG